MVKVFKNDRHSPQETLDVSEDQAKRLIQLGYSYFDESIEPEEKIEEEIEQEEE